MRSLALGDSAVAMGTGRPEGSVPPAPSGNLEGDSVEVQGTCGADASYEATGSGGQGSAEGARRHALLQGGTVMAETLNKLTASRAQLSGDPDVDPVHVDGRGARPRIQRESL